MGIDWEACKMVSLRNKTPDFSLYACLNKRQYKKVISGQYGIQIPRGISAIAKRRGLYFNCENKELFDILTNALDEDGINWINT